MVFAWQELVGYAASALVVTSLAMTSVVRLRIISLLGSLTFVTYGVLIGSVPILLTNTAIALLNIMFLTREFRGERDLDALVVPPDSPFLVDFLHHHADDIRRSQPDADLEDPGFAILLTRDGLPAGIVLGDRDDTRVSIRLDYVLAAHRDSRLGHWLYGPGAKVLTREGVSTITATATTESHRAYLQRMGFTPDTPERWTLHL